MHLLSLWSLIELGFMPQGAQDEFLAAAKLIVQDADGWILSFYIYAAQNWQHRSCYLSLNSQPQPKLSISMSAKNKPGVLRLRMRLRLRRRIETKTKTKTKTAAESKIRIVTPLIQPQPLHPTLKSQISLRTLGNDTPARINNISSAFNSSLCRAIRFLEWVQLTRKFPS